jgi:V8-like Glu-specific endopeptidase
LKRCAASGADWVELTLSEAQTTHLQIVQSKVNNWEKVASVGYNAWIHAAITIELHFRDKTFADSLIVTKAGERPDKGISGQQQNAMAVRASECRVLYVSNSCLAHDCQTTPGASGSSLLRILPDNSAEIVAIHVTDVRGSRSRCSDANFERLRSDKNSNLAHLPN